MSAHNMANLDSPGDFKSLSSVYRLQLSKDFPFKKAQALFPYLEALGIEGVYFSPIFQNAGNGYDITDPLHPDPSLGTQEEFKELCAALQTHGLKHILDIVPNHMGIHGGTNRWWLDVLEFGPLSSYATFFDIDWTAEKKVLLPLLKDSYKATLEKQEITLIWKEGFWIRYVDNTFPIALHSYFLILGSLFFEKEDAWEACLSIAKRLLEKIPKEQLIDQKKHLLALYNYLPLVRDRIQLVTSSFRKLEALLSQQFYRLALWTSAREEGNYRRFFNINDLVAIHIEKEKVFTEYHAWIFEIIQLYKIAGIRIDHPDGLYEPARYFHRLRSLCSAGLVVEKILTYPETLPETWEVDGTVGYDFLHVLDGLFVEKSHGEAFQKIYESFIGAKIDFKAVLRARKLWFLDMHMESDVRLLASLANEFSEKKYALEEWTSAIKELIACTPVYRTYIHPEEPLQAKDRKIFTSALESAKHHFPSKVYDFFKSLFLLEKAYPDPAQDFILRFHQLTTTAMAKGLEDSTFYLYNRLISLNEVGGNPYYFGHAKAEFHRFCKEKQLRWPLGFLTSSTHDTKYSEDVRARIHVLSEIPERWKALVDLWGMLNAPHKKCIEGELVPDKNTEYYLYQLLLGIWPATEDRLWRCMQKILREQGIHTSWLSYKEHYEHAVKEFLHKLLIPHTPFYSSFTAFQQELLYYGRLNSLSALLIKIGACGIVDIYQGNEIWNEQLVDPDNRSSVDFALRKEMLHTLPVSSPLDTSLFQDLSKDTVKLYLTSVGLNFRKKHKELFLKGDYVPLEVRPSPLEHHVIAFLRTYKNQLAIVLAGRFFTKLSRPPIGKECWKDAVAILPPKIKKKKLYNVLTQETLLLHEKGGSLFIPLAEAFARLPWALYKS